jgi:VanZ family protein
MALIWFLSSQHGDALSIPSGFDKAAHVVEFGFLGFLLGRGVGHSRLWMAFAVAVAWGGLDEWHQSRVPFRTASLWDVAADAIGALAGVILAAAGRKGS